MSTLEIRLFGTLSVRRDGQSLTRFPGKRVKDLLSYLLLNRDTLHPREQVAGLFWDDLDDRKARHCLNTALWRLNQALARAGQRDHPYLRIDAETIGFNTASDFRLDVADFESYCMVAKEVDHTDGSRQAALYRQAVDLYQADLLVDCHDDWCIIERERLARLYTGALGRLVEYYSALGEHETAIEYALRILASDPLREEVHRDVIRLYLASNRPTAALRQYRTCEDVIRRELGIDPMPETQALFSQIMTAPESAVVMETRPSDGASVVLANMARGLTDALAGLHQAVFTFETAYSQLLDAAGRLAAVADDLGGASDTGVVEPYDGNSAVSAQFQHGRNLIAEAIQRIDQVKKANNA